MGLTYNGATAGSTLANPPACIETAAFTGEFANSGGLTGSRLWFYTSTNAAADLTSSGAIADGYALGMRPGDLFFGVTATAGSTSPIAYFGVVGKVSSGSTISVGVGSSGAALSANVVTSTAA